MNWTDFLDKFGFPTAIAGFLGWFLVTKLWPYLKGLMEESNSERRQLTDRLSSVLEANVATNQRIADRLQSLDDGVKGLRSDKGRKR